MTLAGRARIFSRAYNDFRAIEFDRDLRRNRLTLSDYDSVRDCLQTLSNLRDIYTDTSIKSVADWFKRHRFKVREHGINYRISIV